MKEGLAFAHSTTPLPTNQVTTPDDLGAVEVEVLMPAGLEPVDPNLTPGSPAATCGLQFSNPSAVFWWWWWPACPAQATRPDVVTFRFARLPSGASSVQFTAVAATPGVWALPPVKASAEQQPEVMGMTPAGSFAVCSATCVAEPAQQPQALVACPNSCSGNGSCRLDVGRCVCSSGFAGADCSEMVVVEQS